jgi:hypothetical protein
VAHEQHLEHVAHEEHVAHLSSADGRPGRESTRRVRRPRPRARLHLAVAGGATVVVVAAVAGTAIVLSGHSGSSSGPGTAAAAAVATSTVGGGAGTGGGGGTVVVPAFTESFSMTRHIISCVGGCITGPLPLTIVCHHDGSCTASSSHWGSSHPGTLNGSTLSFSGVDTGVSGCDQPNQITLNLTVTAWSAGSADTRRPLSLSGPYDVTGPATSGCSAWDLRATLTSQ